ncbi:MAG: DNA-directed RNA polymerase subunit L [Metallosphaera yellowstonensis]|jgi:DNA-directed RNA polymerase subunit L|uniref:DNA-directed RNA polymerase subunit Rpo11 n=1 Tax=Metallosphaera yellowstonensis MK1 TaxID=671065 RepID=H2C9Q9_9CREN|nr:DNA-directed RNA polymerase subunit L [Metallosphaera yellowstonensis]EHP68885.1 DNA-directed RNA polymerase, subunit L [Metallosphaera yellowstonensis MK1]
MEVRVDKRSENYLELRLAGEDHTLGNLLAGALREVKGVSYASYYQPHPLNDEIVLKIMTDGTISPLEALNKALDAVRAMGEKFLEELKGL